MEDNQLQMILESSDIDNLDIKGPAFQAFRRYFRNQFTSHKEYQQQLRLLQSRPELIPYYILEYQKEIAEMQRQMSSGAQTIKKDPIKKEPI